MEHSGDEEADAAAADVDEGGVEGGLEVALEVERCDCGGQLESAIEIIKDHGAGVVLYLRQEGRGIGLANKLRAYELQDQGADTVDANLQLGFQADERDFRVAAHMLKSMGIQKLRLLTNNPQKVEIMRSAGLEVCERIGVSVEPGEFNTSYLKTKAQRFGHIF